MSISQTNMIMRHKENSHIGILDQKKSIIINSMLNISNEYINGEQKESLYQNPQSRWSTNMIDHANVPSENSGTDYYSKSVIL